MVVDASVGLIVGVVVGVAIAGVIVDVAIAGVVMLDVVGVFDFAYILVVGNPFQNDCL